MIEENKFSLIFNWLLPLYCNPRSISSSRLTDLTKSFEGGNGKISDEFQFHSEWNDTSDLDGLHQKN